MTKDTSPREFPVHTAEAALGIIKLVSLANAGGVAATITGIGALAKNGSFESILALPLFMFSLGVASTIGYAMSLYLRIAEHEGFEPAPTKWLVSDSFTRWSGRAAVILFIGGCLSGTVIVACV
ncbi:MAG: hypothetical protein NUV50_14565 [Rhodospirillales bacterium]|nr:hypothetical protein [Rhodospirillales bacterium]